MMFGLQHVFTFLHSVIPIPSHAATLTVVLRVPMQATSVKFQNFDVEFYYILQNCSQARGRPPASLLAHGGVAHIENRLNMMFVVENTCFPLYRRMDCLIPRLSPTLSSTHPPTRTPTDPRDSIPHPQHVSHSSYLAPLPLPSPLHMNNAFLFPPTRLPSSLLSRQHPLTQAAHISLQGPH